MKATTKRKAPVRRKPSEAKVLAELKALRKTVESIEQLLSDMRYGRAIHADGSR